MARYRIKDRAPNHFIGGRVVGAGEVVTLPPGVAPGQWLEPIDEAPEPVETPAPVHTARRGRKAAAAPEPVIKPAPPVAESSEGEF